MIVYRNIYIFQNLHWKFTF